MTAEDDLRPYFPRLAEPARTDITEAHIYFVALTSFVMADEWEAGLVGAIRRLAATPHRQIAERESRLLNRPVRQAVYPRTPNGPAYYLFFTVTEDASAPGGRGYLDILHVRHAARRPLTRTEAGELRRALGGGEGAL